MTTVEELTVTGLFAGPVVAVLISLWIEERRRQRLLKEQAVRTLLVGRLNFADPAFLTAINTMPVAFPKDQAVLAAWEAYLESVRTPPDRDDPASVQSAQGRWEIALSNLIESMLESMGYPRRAAKQIARARYVSDASANLLRLQQEALSAVVEVARNTSRMAEANEALLQGMRQQAQRVRK
jgi:hypothetical protein